MRLTLHFDITEMLPVIRKAFDDKELQMFTHEPGQYGCLYAGPCAIGVCVPEPLRPLLDAGTVTMNEFAAYTLFERGTFTCPENQREDIVMIQELHDVCVGGAEEDKLYRVKDIDSISTVIDMSAYAEGMKMPTLQTALIGKRSDEAMYITDTFDNIKFLIGARV